MSEENPLPGRHRVQAEDGYAGRGQRRPRHAHDAYQTPDEFAQAGLLLVAGAPEVVIDPGAGDGVWGAWARALWPECRIIGVELRPLPRPAAYDDWITGDFLSVLSRLPPAELVVGNPPFAHAEPFIRGGLSLLRTEGELLFLLRAAFRNSGCRNRGLFVQHPPWKVWSCDRRPRFYGSGSGMTDFCYFHWQQGFAGIPLNPTAAIDDLVTRWPAATGALPDGVVPPVAPVTPGRAEEGS